MPDDVVEALAGIDSNTVGKLKIDVVKPSEIASAVHYRSVNGYSPKLMIRAGETDIRAIDSFAPGMTRPVGEKYLSDAENKVILISAKN